MKTISNMFLNIKQNGVVRVWIYLLHINKFFIISLNFFYNIDVVLYEDEKYVNNIYATIHVI